MTPLERCAIIASAGAIAEDRLPTEQRGTRWSLAVHESAHAILALRTGKVPFRAWVRTNSRRGRGAVNFSEHHRGRPPSDAASIELAARWSTESLPSACVREWVEQRRLESWHYVVSNWSAIISLAKLLNEKGTLSRDDILLHEIRRTGQRAWWDWVAQQHREAVAA